MTDPDPDPDIKVGTIPAVDIAALAPLPSIRTRISFDDIPLLLGARVTESTGHLVRIGSVRVFSDLSFQLFDTDNDRIHYDTTADLDLYL